MNTLQLNKVSPTEEFAYCNHHHELTEDYEVVDFGDGKFVANKSAIPLLKALNEAGLRTRTHHMDNEGGFIGILMDNVTIEVRPVAESSDRTRYNGKMEILILWKKN